MARLGYNQKFTFEKQRMELDSSFEWQNSSNKRLKQWLREYPSVVLTTDYVNRPRYRLERDGVSIGTVSVFISRKRSYMSGVYVVLDRMPNNYKTRELKRCITRLCALALAYGKVKPKANHTHESVVYLRLAPTPFDID